MTRSADEVALSNELSSRRRPSLARLEPESVDYPKLDLDPSAPGHQPERHAGEALCCGDCWSVVALEDAMSNLYANLRENRARLSEKLGEDWRGLIARHDLEDDLS